MWREGILLMGVSIRGDKHTRRRRYWQARTNTKRRRSSLKKAIEGLLDYIEDCELTC